MGVSHQHRARESFKKIKNHLACFRINISPILKLALKIGGGCFTVVAFLLSCFSWEDIGVKDLWVKIIILLGICAFAFLLSSFLIVFVFKTQRIWSNGKNKVTAFYGDLMALSFPKKETEKRIVVIPVNDAFDTLVQDSDEKIAKPLISANTLHGMWLNAFLPLMHITSEELNQRIDQNLKLNGISPSRVIDSRVKKEGNVNSYPLGTVAQINGVNGVAFYLLVVSIFDENNNAQSSRRGIRNATDSLIDYYDSKGQGETMYVPLMGAGSSRAGLNHQQSLDVIKSCILTSEKKINGSIIVVAYKGDRDKVSIFNK